MKLKKTHYIAYCYPPSFGGPLTRFMNLRKGLLPLGWRMLYLGVGPCSVKADVGELLKEDYVYIGEGRKENIQKEVTQFINFVNVNNLNIVVTYGDLISIQALPYLHKAAKVVYICATPTRHAMVIAANNVERINRIIAVSEAIRLKLISDFGLPSGKVRTIPSEVDLSLYPTIGEIKSRSLNHPIRLLFLGRIRDVDKGVDLLPKILNRLARYKVQFHLTIIGDGPQRSWLSNKFKKMGLNSDVEFLGGIQPEELPRLIYRHDILLMPSRFEGCPRVLLEAMATGVVPVASFLRGATDTIIDHSTNGLLCSVGKPKTFADAVYHLWRTPEHLKAMAVAARKRIEEKFSLTQRAKTYDSCFTAVMNEPATHVSALPISQFKPDKKLYELNRSWRSKIPVPIKKIALAWRARWSCQHFLRSPSRDSEVKT